MQSTFLRVNLMRALEINIANVRNFSDATYSRFDLLISVKPDEKCDGAANFKFSAETLQILSKSNLPLEFAVYIDNIKGGSACGINGVSQIKWGSVCGD